MKKTLTTLFLFVSLFLFSQNLELTGGLNFSKVAFIGTNEDITSGTGLGFKIGLNYEKEIFENAYIQPGIAFTNRRWNFKFIGKVVYQTYYLEIPALFKYKFEFIPDNYLIFSTGPSLSIGLFGQTITTSVTVTYDSDFNYEEYEETTVENLSFGTSSKNDLTPLDGGLNFGFGYQYNKFNFSFNYYLGLFNVNPSSNFIKLKYRIVQINFGYYLF